APGRLAGAWRAAFRYGAGNARTQGEAMDKVAIEPHFRLQEWVAEEKGYFRDEGLDYEFNELVQSSNGAIHQAAGKVGAFQSIEKGRASNVTCACHWTVNVAGA